MPNIAMDGRTTLTSSTGHGGITHGAPGILAMAPRCSSQQRIPLKREGHPARAMRPNYVCANSLELQVKSDVASAISPTKVTWGLYRTLREPLVVHFHLLL
jgi:hypothetical protein